MMEAQIAPVREDTLIAELKRFKGLLAGWEAFLIEGIPPDEIPHARMCLAGELVIVARGCDALVSLMTEGP